MKPQIFSNDTVVEWAKRRIAGESYQKIGQDAGRSAGNVYNIIHNRMKSHPDLLTALKEAEAQALEKKRDKFQRWGRLNTQGGMSFRQIELAEGVSQGEALRQYRVAMRRWPEWKLPEPKTHQRKPAYTVELAARIWKRHGVLRHWGMTAKEFNLPSGDAAAQLCRKHQAAHPQLFPAHPETPFTGLHPDTVEQAIRTRLMIRDGQGWPEIAKAFGKPKTQAMQCYRAVRKRDPKNWPLPGNPDWHTDQQGLRWARDMANGTPAARIAAKHGASPATIHRAITRALARHPEEALRLGNVQKKQREARRERRVQILKEAATLQQTRSLGETAAALGISPRTLQQWRRKEHFPMPPRRAKPKKPPTRKYTKRSAWPLGAWIEEVRAGKTMEQIAGQNGISLTRVSQLLNGHDAAALKDALREGRIQRAAKTPARRHHPVTPQDLDGWLHEIEAGTSMRDIGARHQITASRVSELLRHHSEEALRAALQKSQKQAPPAAPQEDRPEEAPALRFRDRTGKMSKQTFHKLLADMEKRHQAEHEALARQLDKIHEAKKTP